MERAQIATRLEQARKDLGVTIGQLAIACRVHPATLHRILTGKTANPRGSTIRALARVLRIPLEELTDQIEHPALTESYEVGHKLERVLSSHFYALEPDVRGAAAYAAVVALFDVGQETGRHRDMAHLQSVTRAARSRSGRDARLVAALISQFRDLPRLLQRRGAREAVRAMIDVQLRAGFDPTTDLLAAGKAKELRILPPLLGS